MSETGAGEASGADLPTAGEEPDAVRSGGVIMDAEALHDFMTDAFGRPLDWEILRVDEDGVSVRQGVDTSQLRPGGTVSGPTLMSLADGVAFLVVLSRIGPAALAVTSNLNINFLRRPRLGDIVGEGRLLKLGRSLALTEVSLYSVESDPKDADAEPQTAGDETVGNPPVGDGPSADYSINRSKPVAHATVTYSLALLQQENR